MKNLFKFLGVISLALVIGFSMVSCDDDDEEGGNPGGGGGGNFDGTWKGTQGSVEVTVVINGDSITIKANSKEFTGTLEAATTKENFGLTQYTRKIKGKTDASVSKWSDADTIELVFLEFGVAIEDTTFGIPDGIWIQDMTK